MSSRFLFPCYIAAVAVLLSGCASVRSGKTAGKVLIPAETLSPDGRYGVTVPVFDCDNPDKETEPCNTLIEVRTKRVLTVINGETGFNRTLNFHSIPVASWSSDSSLLLWEVDGKWYPLTLMLLKVEKGEVQWQRDLMTIARQAILPRTREASPKKYAAAKKGWVGKDFDYWEGFTIAAVVLEPISFPLHIRAALTTNPKGIEGNMTLESHLDGVIDEQGKFTVTDFKLGHAELHNW